MNWEEELEWDRKTAQQNIEETRRLALALEATLQVLAPYVQGDESGRPWLTEANAALAAYHAKHPLPCCALLIGTAYSSSAPRVECELNRKGIYVYGSTSTDVETLHVIRGADFGGKQ